MTCLVVDDEKAARSRMCRLLASHPGVEVVGEASDGLEAIEKIERLCPDIAFLDIQMPGLNGFEVVRSLRGRPRQPLIIFVTGFDQHALEAFEASALAYLLKPVEPERRALRERMESLGRTAPLERLAQLARQAWQEQRARRVRRAQPVLLAPWTWAITTPPEELRHLRTLRPAMITRPWVLTRSTATQKATATPRLVRRRS